MRVESSALNGILERTGTPETGLPEQGLFSIDAYEAFREWSTAEMWGRFYTAGETRRALEDRSVLDGTEDDEAFQAVFETWTSLIPTDKNVPYNGQWFSAGKKAGPNARMGLAEFPGQIRPALTLRQQERERKKITKRLRETYDVYAPRLDVEDKKLAVCRGPSEPVGQNKRSKPAFTPEPQTTEAVPVEKTPEIKPGPLEQEPQIVQDCVRAVLGAADQTMNRRDLAQIFKAAGHKPEDVEAMLRYVKKQAWLYTFRTGGHQYFTSDKEVVAAHRRRAAEQSPGKKEQLLPEFDAVLGRMVIDAMVGSSRNIPKYASLAVITSAMTRQHRESMPAEREVAGKISVGRVAQTVRWLERLGIARTRQSASKFTAGIPNPEVRYAMTGMLKDQTLEEYLTRQHQRFIADR